MTEEQELSLMHIEQLPGEQMRFVLKGDALTVSKMIRTVMNNRSDVAAAMISAVLTYSKEEHNMKNFGDLKKFID